MGRPKKDEQSKPLRIPESLRKRIRTLAAHHDIDASDYAARLLLKVIDEEERAMVKEINKGLKGGK